VTIDGETHALPQPFMVIATQNPFEFEGTYPLPESQLDRFLMRIGVGYPEREDEIQVLSSHRMSEPVESLRPVLDAQQVIALQQAVRQVTVDESINGYLLDIVDSTRKCEELRVGVSTRGALCLYRAAQALALVENRSFVIPDDVKRLTVPVLSHRVIAKGYLQGTHRQAMEALIGRLVEEVAVPR
jgi:MoxR-like ATPase